MGKAWSHRVTATSDARDINRAGAGLPAARFLPALLVAALGALVLAATMPPVTPSLEFDHLWLVVSPGAPEREALERAGFRIAPGVNRHDGQGTASVTVEFDNAFLELIWPDSSVSVAKGRGFVQERYRRRMDWRTSRWSPVGVGLRRVGAEPDTLPFPTWYVRSDWMRPGPSTARGAGARPT